MQGVIGYNLFCLAPESERGLFLEMKDLEKIKTINGKRFLFRVETSSDHRDYAKYEEMRNEIWGEPKDSLPGTRNMKCENFLHEGSSLFIGVFVESPEGEFILEKDHMVGYSYGFIGIKNKEAGFRDPRNLQFYSQYTCVRPDFQQQGLGILIKEFQKEKLIELFGVTTTTCTFDPLTGVNAYRNIHHFGMEVVEYRVAAYSDFGGWLNRQDIPCDRFFVTWELKKDLRRPEYGLEALLRSECLAVRARGESVRGRSGMVELDMVGEMNLSLDRELLLVEIPVDFYTMLRETDVQDASVRRIPLDWRLKTREAFQILLERGYRIIDFRLHRGSGRTRDFYVLQR